MINPSSGSFQDTSQPTACKASVDLSKISMNRAKRILVML
jgi:hypothetical protein